ncbi:MAG TPA: non-homologous end-joining DNA ligase [Actinomycetota bacterium]
MPAAKRISGAPFSIRFPEPLPVERRGDAWRMEMDGHQLRLSNLDKVFWPDEGYTKGDLVAYYHNASGLILPYLRDRPLTMKRMPDGVAGDFFYEKSAPPHTPDWITRCLVPSEESRNGVIDYLMVNDAATLLFVANLGCVEMHPLHSRCSSVETPDYLFFDLDPFEPIAFEDVLAVAMHVKAALDALGLVGYPKTSGATGVQIYVSVRPGFSYEQVRDFVGALGRTIARADRERVTMAWKVSSRMGKVFIDHNMNRSGANIAAAYSLRPEPGATVSTPLTWEEVERGVDPRDFTIETVWERFAKVGDLFEGVRTAPQDLGEALRAMGVSRGRGARRAEGSPQARPTVHGARTSKQAIAQSKDLADYVRKRDFSATPEPAPSDDRAAGSSFVIHKHRATRLHYDLRLERDGALSSWAVPRGLPTQKGDKRLAVRTEDHPLEYARFQGTIPEGHYGAGEVRIFDEGTHEILEWNDGKVSFRLFGRRRPGLEYHLVRTRTDWLVFLASHQDVPLISSPPPLQPMLAEGGHEPFDDPSWRFEPKLDGIRCLAHLATDVTRLVTRTGRDATNQYPELRMVHELVDQVNAVLDCEIVAFDESGRNSFEALQQRMNLTNEREIKRIANQVPVSLVAFDVLWLDGRDLTDLPLKERRDLLESIVEQDSRLQLVTYVEGTGRQLTLAAHDLGLEGVMAKRTDSRYQPGRRSADWRKVKLTNTQDCVILGWTPGQGGRTGTFGALLVGAYADGRLRWIGQVGTGFTDRMLDRLIELLRPLVTKEPASSDPALRRVKGATFVKPSVVCEVEYLEITKSTGKMRAPSFKGLRDDKAPEECMLERPVAASPSVRRRR